MGNENRNKKKNFIQINHFQKEMELIENRDEKHV